MSDLPVVNADPAATAKFLATRNPDDALTMLEGIALTPGIVDLEVALHILPRVRARLAHLMAIKGIAEMVITDSLKEREGRQRVYGGHVYGLKDGAWIMGETDARALLRYLTTYVGDDFTQEQLDKGVRLDPVYAAGTCSAHGEYVTAVACRTCGEVMEGLVVNHTGLNAIEKVARAEVKKRLDGTSPETLRRRAEPGLTVKAQA